MPRPKSITTHSRRDEWELHRRELFRLYIVENITVTEIASYMKQKHGFDKKPKDYEYRLNKKWNLRRNLHEQELRFICDLVQRRCESGRLSEIVISGKKRPESMILGRLNRHKNSSLLGDQRGICELPDFLARVQTPSLLMLDLPEWPTELPWLQFDRSFRQALAPLTDYAFPDAMSRVPGQGTLLIKMMRPYITSLHEPFEVFDVHPPQKMRAMLEMIAPQVHEGDHETTAEVLHNGSTESMAVELARLIIYLETNNMIDRLRDITGFTWNLSAAEHLMEFLRRIGLLTKSNINNLARSTNPTAMVFLKRILQYSIADGKSLDVLGWLVPDHFNINHTMDISGFCSSQGTLQFEARTYGCLGNLLQASSLMGNIQAVDLLLDLGEDPYNCGPRNEAPLVFAALQPQGRATAIASLLLSKKTRASSEFQMKALEDALKLAINRDNTELIPRLLSERERLGHGTICSRHFKIAAGRPYCETMRLLVDHAQRGGHHPITLPKDVLFAAFPADSFLEDPDLPSEKLNYLLGLGADPAVPICSQGCSRSFFLDYVVGLSTTVAIRENPESILHMVDALRKHGCLPERPEPASGAGHGPSALQAAIFSGFSRLVEYILDWGANIDHYNDPPGESVCGNCGSSSHPALWQRSPLLTALEEGHIEIAKMLLRRQPDLKLRGGEQQLAMKHSDDTQLVTMLLQAGAESLDAWKYFLDQAIFWRNPNSIKLLLSRGTYSHATIDHATLLQAAVITGDCNEAYHQVALSGYNSRALFETVLQSHSVQDFQKIVERLLETRPNTLNDGCEVLAVAFAAVHNDLYLMGVLMESLGQGPWVAQFPFVRIDDDTYLSRWIPEDPDPRGSPTHILTFAENVDGALEGLEVMDTLLKFNVSAEGMHLDICNGSTAERWKLLIAAGADPNSGTALLGAVTRNMLEHVEVLCEAQVPLNLMRRFDQGSDSTSRTAVQLAVEHGSPEMLQMLLHYGADVKTPPGSFHGATCLQIASGAGNIGLVRYLLHKGAKVNEKRSLLNGRTAIEIAAENGRLDILKFLLLQEENLLETAPERYQFIRAAKLADRGGHNLISQILKQHINWDSDDQRLFDEIDGFGDMVFQLDDMTQISLDCEKLERGFESRLGRQAYLGGVRDLGYIEGIDKWIGKEARETLAGSIIRRRRYKSHRENYTRPHASSNKFEHRREAQETSNPVGKIKAQVEHQSDKHLAEKLTLASDDVLDASIHSAYLHPAMIDGWPASQFQSLRLNSELRQGAGILAPRAIRHDTNIPGWLGMQDMDMNATMQEVTSRRWEALAHRPATPSVAHEPRMVLEGVLDDVPHIDDKGDDTFDHNEVGKLGEAEHSHVPQFNWGFWDDEAFKFHSTAWENWNIGSGSAS